MAGNATAAPNVVSKYEQRLNEKMADYISIKDVIEAISNQYGCSIDKARGILAQAIKTKWDEVLSKGLQSPQQFRYNLYSGKPTPIDLFKRGIAGAEAIDDSSDIFNSLIRDNQKISEELRDSIPF